jgi:tetratricopeptide (TPR) repeat protein
MRNLFTITTVVVATFMMGCSAALVPMTSNPDTKIRQAYQLMDLGRVIPAKKLLDEALVIYLERNDEMNIARVYSSYGSLYYGPKGQGPFELPNFPESFANFDKAISIYERLKQPKYVALNLWGKALAFAAKKEFDKTCETLFKAKSVYESASDHNELTTPFETNGQFTPAILATYINGYQCGKNNSAANPKKDKIEEAKSDSKSNNSFKK